jgi:hypothetical protein
LITYFSENIGLTDVRAFYTPTLFAALNEVSSGRYEGDLPTGTESGAYSLIIKEGAKVCGDGVYLWDGTREITLLNASGIDPAVLARIDSNSAIARKAVTNPSRVNVANATFTTIDDDGLPLFGTQTFNAAGQPSVIKPVRREKLTQRASQA